MSKKLALLLLPGILFTSCFGLGKKVSFEEFQQITKKSISQGIQLKGNFTIKFEYYNVTPDGDVIDPSATKQYAMTKNGDLLYSLLIDGDEERVFNTVTYAVYQRNSESQFEKIEADDARTYDAFKKWAFTTSTIEDYVSMEKNGDYQFKNNVIKYQMEDEMYSLIDANLKKKSSGLRLSFISIIQKDTIAPHKSKFSLSISSYSSGPIEVID